MSRPTKIVANCSTGITEIVELTDEEIAQLETDRAEYIQRKAEEDAAKAVKDVLKASAKAKLVAGEALTPEEAETLVI
jgi:hypothetical protein